MGTRLIMGLTVTALTVTACAGGAEDGLASREGYSVLAALAELPPAPDTAFIVQTADLVAASELAGHERPTDLDPEAVIGWFHPLTGAPLAGSEAAEREWAPLFVPPPSAVRWEELMRIEEFDELAGWSLVDVDAYAELSTPPHDFTVITGQFDEATLAHLPEAAEGVRTVGEGEDGTVDLTAATAVSPIGRPVRMAHDDGRLAVSAYTEPVQDWLGDPDTSLADHAGLAAVAEALDEEGVVSAMLSAGGTRTHTLDGFPEEVGTSIEGRMTFLPERPFTAVGAGWTVEDGEPLIVLAYYFGDDDAAEDSLGSLETLFAEGITTTNGQPLADLLTLSEITADGPVVVATLHAADPRAPHQVPGMLASRDVPFLHQ